MALPNYSSKNVHIAWGGTNLDGTAADSFVSFSRNSDITSNSVGADGQLMISVLPDSTGSCTLSFQQTSLSNQILSEVLKQQRITGIPIVDDLTVTDPSGSVIAELKNAHIMTAPEVTLNADGAGNTYDWTFYCETIEFGAEAGAVFSATINAQIDAGVNTIISVDI